MNSLLIIRHVELAAPFSYYQLSAVGTTPDGLYRAHSTAQQSSFTHIVLSWLDYLLLYKWPKILSYNHYTHDKKNLGEKRQLLNFGTRTLSPLDLDCKCKFKMYYTVDKKTNRRGFI